MTTYTNKSNARRAAKKAIAGTNNDFEINEGGGKFSFTIIWDTTSAVEDATFYQLFVEYGGTQPRGICKALRVVAAGWNGTKAEFVADAKASGLNACNAAQEFHTGRRS